MCRSAYALLVSALASATAVGCKRDLVVGQAGDAAEEGGAPPSACGSARNGVKGEYFKRIDLTDLAFCRIDPRIDFGWENMPIDPRIGDSFSVRWTGQVEAAFSEAYTFYANVDDGVRLFLDDILLIDAWKPGPQTPTGTVALEAKRRYSLRMEFVDFNYKALAHLWWSSASQPKQIIPESQLFPAP